MSRPIIETTGEELPVIAAMPAISLWRPWADWVLLGWKTIETRTHARFRVLAGQRIAIHAAQKWDTAAIHHARRWLTPDQLVQTAHRQREPLDGAILCTVHVQEYIPLLRPGRDEWGALIECATFRSGLVLTGVQPVTPPQCMSGSQGIFKVTLRAAGDKLEANSSTIEAKK